MQNDSSPELVIPPVEHFAEYVIGFPMHVVITVVSPPNVTFNGLRFADFLDLRECIGAEIAGPDGYAAKYRPTPDAEGRPLGDAGRLASGESHRMLVDVSPYFVRASEGQYQASFSFLDSYRAYTAPTVTFLLRLPTAEEAALLTAVAPDRPGFVTWGEWTTHCPAALYPDLVGQDHPLRFNLVVRELLCGATPLDRVDPAALDVLTGLYAPEARAMQAELYRIREDRGGYDAIRSRLLRETPGLAWWIRMIDRGGGYLKSLRFLP